MIVMSMEMWPREACDKRARTNAEAVLQKGLPPSEDELKWIYGFWSKKYYWTVEEAAALVMGADPRVFAAYEFLPLEDRKTFDRMVDFIRRRFPNNVFPF